MIPATYLRIIDNRVALFFEDTEIKRAFDLPSSFSIREALKNRFEPKEKLSLLEKAEKDMFRTET